MKIMFVRNSSAEDPMEFPGKNLLTGLAAAVLLLTGLTGCTRLPVRAAATPAPTSRGDDPRGHMPREDGAQTAAFALG
jgi:hypothetical protein